MSAVYGDLGQDARFAGAFERWLNRLWAVGTKQTLAEYLA
jgi:mannitol 2-dehydrogenase